MKLPADIKQKLLARCFEYVDQRIETSRQAMNDAQASANEEGKSSAGDKYETGRAMAQIERDKAAQQLEEALKLKSVLDSVNPTLTNEAVTLGSLVVTESDRFYLAISIGKAKVDGFDFLIIAPTAPIGQALLKLKKGNQFSFNKKTQVIQEIL